MTSTHHPAPLVADRRTFGFRVAHRALRRDTARLARALPNTSSAEDTRAVRAWFDRFADTLEHHHRIEDDIWWPMLREATDGFELSAAAMRHQHEHLDVAVGDLRNALADLDAVAPGGRDEARRVATTRAVALDHVVGEHLDDEETVVFPVLAAAPQAAVTSAERATGRRDSLASLRFALPWALDSADAALTAEIMTAIPGLMRPLVRRWDRRYRRRFDRFLNLSAATPEPAGPATATAATEGDR